MTYNGLMGTLNLNHSLTQARTAEEIQQSRVRKVHHKVTSHSLSTEQFDLNNSNFDVTFHLTVPHLYARENFRLLVLTERHRTEVFLKYTFIYISKTSRKLFNLSLAHSHTQTYAKLMR